MEKDGKGFRGKIRSFTRQSSIRDRIDEHKEYVKQLLNNLMVYILLLPMRALTIPQLGTVIDLHRHSSTYASDDYQSLGNQYAFRYY